MTTEQENKIYLGIDWGEKRIGLAIGDSETRIATPYKTVTSAAEVARVVRDDKIDVIIIGAPYPIDNTGFRPVENLRDFMIDLKKKVSVPIELYDERLTSKAADNLPGSRKTKAKRDEIAAMLILQHYLDALKQANG